MISKSEVTQFNVDLMQKTLPILFLHLADCGNVISHQDSVLGVIHMPTLDMKCPGALIVFLPNSSHGARIENLQLDECEQP